MRHLARLLLGCLVQKSTSNINAQISYLEHGNLTSFVAISELEIQQLNARFSVGSEWLSFSVLQENVANCKTPFAEHKTI
jgi:hypothetical protein